ncbi:MAG: polysaccharide deacetylase family protein [Paracoccaceae bacterium]
MSTGHLEKIAQPLRMKYKYFGAVTIRCPEMVGVCVSPLFIFGQFLSKVTAPGQLSVLMYHGTISKPLYLPDACFIPLDEFSKQMQWLDEMKVDVLPLPEAVVALCEQRLRRPCVALTFDDGYRSNLTQALPVLERFGFHATVYLTTGLTGTDRTLWPSRLNLALSATAQTSLTWSGLTFALGSQAERAAALQHLQETVKMVAGDAPEHAVTEIEALLGTGEVRVGPDSPFAMMAADDLRSCLRSELINFGAHSVSHPLLSRLDDQRLSEEINGSIDTVEDLTGRSCQSFAYPNGQKKDFDMRSIECLHNRGVRTAVSAIEGPNRPTTDPMQIRRWGIGTDVSRKRFGGVALNVVPEAIRANLSHRFGLAGAGSGP